jgi:hypothetical protein
MAETKFLTAEEVSQRYRGEITVGTLRNWRAMRIGPPFVKIGRAVLYGTALRDISVAQAKPFISRKRA